MSRPVSHGDVLCFSRLCLDLLMSHILVLVPLVYNNGHYITLRFCWLCLTLRSSLHKMHWLHMMCHTLPLWLCLTLRSSFKEVISCGAECGPILNECWDEYEGRDEGAFAPRSLLEAAVITLLHSSVLKLGVLTGEGGWGMAGIYDWFVLPLDLKFWNVTQFEETTKIALLYRCCYH